MRVVVITGSTRGKIFRRFLLAPLRKRNLFE